MEIKNGKPKCLVCGTKLELDYDISIDDGYGGLTANVKGTCPKCQQEHLWMEHYIYQGFSQLKKRLDIEDRL
jgi:5-methylcytosine-specific restriction endonuclease McrA